eukprot:4406106-Pleurochrysis_carterae.AAC.10
MYTRSTQPPKDRTGRSAKSAKEERTYRRIMRNVASYSCERARAMRGGASERAQCSPHPPSPSAEARIRGG